MHGGGVIAYPTEAVWGFGCDPSNPKATAKLLAIKERPVEKGLILVAATIEQFSPLLKNLSEQQIKTLEESWPGPNTWIVPCAPGTVPYWVNGGKDSVALRVSAHPVVQALCREFGGPIVSTSANVSSRQPARNVFEIQKNFSKEGVLIVPGPLGREAKPTTIRNIITGETVRA